MSSSSASSSSSDGTALTVLPAPTESSMPQHMFYTSLSWLASSSGIPLLAGETPPTSPARPHSASKTGPGAESPAEQRRQRQAAFIAQKNKELEELRKKTVKDLIAESSEAKESGETSLSSLSSDSNPSTPLSTPVKAKPAQTPDASTLVSPEKRRAKKLSSLQYPIFSVYWWQPPVSGNKSGGDNSSEDPSLGLVLLGGGGGKKGAGIDSGMLVCSVLPSDSAVFAESSSPIRMSSVSSAALSLNPLSFLDSNDFLIGSLLPHPTEPVLAATVGAGTALLRAEPSSNNAAAGLEVRYEHARQTDFHKELNAQAQAWSPSGEWLVTGGEDKVIRVWSYPSLQLIAVASGNELALEQKDEQHRQPILSLHVNADGTRLASCAGDGHVKIWNMDALATRDTSSAEILTLPLIHNLTIPPTQKGSILKFQVARFYGKERNQAGAGVKDGVENTPACSASSDEYLIAISSQIKRGGGSSALVKWDTNDYAIIKQVSTGQAPLTTMEISDDIDDPFVALANTDGLVAVYRAESMKCIKKVAKVHDLPTTALAFSPAGLTSSSASASASSRWLVSASADKSVAIIEVPTSTNNEGGVFISLIFLILAILAAAGGLWIGANPQAWSHFGV